MALINCPDCNTEVSDKALQCPRCAYPISTINNPIIATVQRQNSLENTNSNVQQSSISTLVALASKKSEGLSFVLTFLFGPFGLLYGNPKKAGAVIITTIVICFAIAFLSNGKTDSYFMFAGIVGVISWIASIVLGSQGVEEYNNSLLETEADKALEIKQNLDTIDQLRKNIKTEKYRAFYEPSYSTDILKLLKELCVDKDKTEWLFMEYKSRFNRNVSEDLQSLSESDRKQYLDVVQQFDKTE